MIAEQQERLIQDVLEGDASPAQIAELKHLIETNAEVRARHEEMTGVFRLFAEVQPVDPPSAMHDDIVRAIAAEPGHGASARPRTHGRGRTLVPVWGAFLAGAVAASLVVVAVLRGPGAGRFSDGAPTSGTLAPAPSARGSVASRGSIDAGGGRIELVTRRASDEVRLEIHARCARSVDIECEFPSEALGLTGLRWSRPPAGPVAVNGGHVMLGSATTGDFVLTFSARSHADAPVRVRATGAGEALLHTASQQPGG